MIVEKVEIGFELTSTVAPFFTLDSPTKGVLDNTEYPLGGKVFFDVTDRVKRYSIRRGKSQQLDNYNTGIASISFTNFDRAFDPTFDGSPFAGQIIPKREVRISTEGQRRFTGLIDDWNLDYSVNGESYANIVVSDGFSRLANQTFSGGTATAQLSGARINAVLDLDDVKWPAANRAVDAGTIMLGADVWTKDAKILDYLQTVEATELGHFFIDKSGNVTFKDANSLVPDSAGLVTFSDDGSAIDYASMQVVYGSELLYNQIVVSSVNAVGTAVADDLDSQALYGIQAFTRTDLLMDNDADVDAHALKLVKDYANPEYRFEAVTVNLDTLSPSEVEQVIGLEIGSFCKITFTPNGIAPAIEKYAEVISINDSVDLTRHAVTFGFSTLDTIPFVLDDTVFGRLDTSTLG